MALIASGYDSTESVVDIADVVTDLLHLADVLGPVDEAEGFRRAEFAEPSSSWGEYTVRTALRAYLDERDGEHERTPCPTVNGDAVR